MWTDAIELGVAMFLAMRDSDDGAIVDRLESFGVEPWLAERLVYWLPTAFGRFLLRDVELGDVYVSGDETHRLSEDPIYAAAAERAGRVTRDEMVAIATRSGEYRMILRAQDDAEARGEDFALEPGSSALALLSPLSPMQPGHGGVLEPREVFAGFVRGHGHEVTAGHGTAQAVDGTELDAFVFPRIEPRLGAQIDYVVRDPRLAGGRLIESFAGFGDTWHAVVGDTVRKLERGSVHVIIATLLDPESCAQQVSWETWPHPSGDYRACIGGQLLLYGADYVDIGRLVDRFIELFAEERVDRAVHSIRLFTARQGTKTHADEVLLDNEPWPAGIAACSGFDWPVRERYWGTRLFLMLTPE